MNWIHRSILVFNRTRINYFINNKYKSIRKEMTKVVEVYYDTKVKFNNIDYYKSYKFFIRRDKKD